MEGIITRNRHEIIIFVVFKLWFRDASEVKICITNGY